MPRDKGLIEMVSQPIPYPALAGKLTGIASEPRPRTGNVPELMPVLRPRLPSAAEILPYLEDIDRRSWYSNGGPLVTRLESELSQYLGQSNVITTANATAGLTAALLASSIPAGSLCLMPSWTFVATPHAARAAGLMPYFHDVDRSTWALDPVEVMETLRRSSQPVGAVIVVSPFGAPLDVPAWEALEDRTGIPVIIDAAAGFDTSRASRIPVVVSLHATKILGAGEGGFISTTDQALSERIKACCNFGFSGSRMAMLAAMNAKMSEYHAAVALANLAKWPAIRVTHERIVRWYVERIGRLGNAVALQPGYGKEWVCGTTSVVLPSRSSARIARRMIRSSIETRAWWGQGCHGQPAFVDCPRGPLPVTEDLGARVLGLPHFPDMRRSDVDAVVDALEESLSSKTVKSRRIA